MSVELSLGSVKQVAVGGFFLVLAVNMAVLDYLAFTGWLTPKPTQTVVQNNAVPANDCDKNCIVQLVSQTVNELKNGITPTVAPITQSIATTGTCDKTCVQDLINKTVPTLVNSVLATQPTPSQSVRASTTPPVSRVSQTRSIDLPGGTASGTDWTKIGNSEFWFDSSLYGTLVSATWQGWLEVQDGNGVGSVRLYDVTNKRAVDGSEVQINSSTKSSFYSKNLSIWRGQNQYRLEVKSSTGYQVTISGAQLKIVFQ